MVGRRAADDVHRVLDDGLERGEHVAHAARGAGQVHDERAVTHAGHAGAERRARKARAGHGAQPLGDAGGVALDHDTRRRRRDVARAEARAAGGEHEIGDVAVAPREELARDRDDVVAHDGARGELAVDGLDPLDDRVARAVGSLAARGRIGDRQHRHAQRRSWCTGFVRDGTRACRRVAS